MHVISSIHVCAVGSPSCRCATFIQAHFVSKLYSVITSMPTDKRLDLEAALSQTFLLVESLWTAHVRALRQTRGFAPVNGVTSGACCTAVLIYGGEVAVANVGDARCVIRRCDGSVEVMTEDHRCQNEGERHRILTLGGFIRNNRVLGILEPTRTIGDLEEKEKTNPGVITALPSTRASVLVDGDVVTGAEMEASLLALQHAIQGDGTIPMTVTSAAKHGHGHAHNGHLTAGGGATTAGRSVGSLPPHAAASFTAAGTAASHLPTRAASAGPGALLHALKGPAAPAATSMAATAAKGGLLAAVARAGASRGAAAAAGRTGGRSGPAAGGPRAGRGGGAGLASTVGRVAQGLNLMSIPRGPLYTFTIPEATAAASALPVCLIIAASDGVWDVLSSASASAIVVYAWALYRDATAAAQELCRMAQRYGSVDDITAAVVVVGKADDAAGAGTSITGAQGAALSGEMAVVDDGPTVAGAAVADGNYNQVMA